MKEIIKWRLVLIGVLIAACFSLLNAQDLNFQEINYTIEDGLPSNECHDILQDSLGYIWIATDRGLVRFDGYTFKSYGIPDGLTNISCLNLDFDKYQNIWIYTLGGQFFKCETKTGTITPFKYQSVIDSFLNFDAAPLDFAVNNDNQLILATNAFGFLSIQLDNGQFHLIRGERNKDMTLSFTIPINNRFLASEDTREFSNLRPRNNKNCIKIPAIDGKSWNCQTLINHKGNLFKAKLNLAGHKNTHGKAFQVFDNISLLQSDGVTYYFENEKLIKAKTNDQYITDILPYADTILLVGGIFKEGLKYFENHHKLMSNQGNLLLDGISISKILVDNEENIWASSLENGLFYLKKNPIQALTIPNLENAIINNIEVNNEKIYLVAEKKQLLVYQNGKFNSIKNKVGGEIRSILYLEELKELIVGGEFNTIAMDNSANQQFFRHYREIYSDVINTASNKIFSFSKKEIFLCQPKDILKYHGISQLPLYRHLSQSNEPIRVITMNKISDNEYLLGTAKGLRHLRKDKIEYLENCPPELKIRINASVKYKKWYIFGTQGNGLFFWDLDREKLHITQKEGLISNNIETLYVDDQSNLYIGTKSGLSKMNLVDLENFTIRNFTQFHGLSSNDIYDIDQKGDSILLATGKGVGILVQDPTPAELHQPKIITVQINNDKFDINEVNESLYYHRNNIRIIYQTLDFKMQSEIPYRYKLNESDWIETMATEANFTALPSNNYTFQLQSQNIDKQWGDTAIFEFTIKEPWWRTAWFSILSLLTLMALGYWFYKNRTNRLKQKISIEREIRNLERSALQAQMNPHFIFNCLNSIQNFIMDNEKENAMEYLGKFAQLIRQSLHASTETKISLHREIQMIQNHLDLEKLRFKNKFDYQINVDTSLNPVEIDIPPLLIQPFVENAILHGMKEKQIDGWININFSREDKNSIKVSIQDNGAGHTENKITGSHKSLGSSITARRLALNNKIKDGSFVIEPQYSSQGTRIDIVIQF